MQYRCLGRTGVRVSELCLGTMTFGEDWQFGASEATSRKIFEEFRACGGNFVDTANTYTHGTSERLVGEFVAEERDSFVVSTKYSLTTHPDDPTGGGCHRKNIRRSIESSLDRLGTDYIDVYWLHAWDSVTAVEEVLRGLDDLVSSGKVLYLGICNTPAWIVSHANLLAELRGWTPFVGLQVEYSLLDRSAEADLLPMARSLGLGVLAWAPLGGGVLTGKYQIENGEVTAADTKRGGWLNGERLTASGMRRSAALERVAESLGRTPAQVAINWLRQQQWGVIPVIGARTVQQMSENLRCLDFVLDASQLEALCAMSRERLGFPHSFLAYEPLLAAQFGSTRNRFIEPSPTPR